LFEPRLNNFFGHILQIVTILPRVLQSLDYRCKDGRSPVSTKLRDNFKPRFAFQQWNRGSSWKKKQKNHFLIGLDVRKPLVVFIAQRKEERRLYNLVYDLTISTPINSGIFKCISWLNGSFFADDHRGFFERGSQDLSNGTNAAS
jgi:hypothetical protein